MERDMNAELDMTYCRCQKEVCAIHGTYPEASAQRDCAREAFEKWLENAGYICNEEPPTLSRYSFWPHEYKNSDIQDKWEGWIASSLQSSERERELKEELDAVLADWNSLVKASGSRTNGGAVGHVAEMKRNLAASSSREAELRDALREILDTLKLVGGGVTGRGDSHVHYACSVAESALSASKEKKS